MTPDEFAALAERNAARVTAYHLGGDGSGGGCDCIGLIIGAWRLGGGKWPWTHGSNYTARHLTEGLGKDQPLERGDLVFKAREPGEKGYALPERYKGDADQRDYYHVGVVLNAAPLRILHCTAVAGGIKTDTARGSWRYGGRLRLLEKEEEMEEKVIVYAANGKPVNLRTGPGEHFAITARLAVGAEATRLSQSGGWSRVRADGREGYMKDGFLKADGEIVRDLDACLRCLDGALKELRAAAEALKGAAAHE